MKLKLIQQEKEEPGCKFACLAMLLGMEYNTVIQKTIDKGVIGKSKSHLRTTAPKLIKIANYFGLKLKKAKFTSWQEITENAIVDTNFEENGNYHWVVYEVGTRGRRLLDPMLNKEITGTPRREARWYLIPKRY